MKDFKDFAHYQDKNQICCICLDETNIKYEKTICCNNYIHKSCFLTWLIYSDFSCCLCRQNPKITVDEIVNYDINYIKTFNIDKQIFIKNLNNIVNESCIVNITENISENLNESNNSSENQVVFTNKRLKNCLILLLIPVFYTILFCIIHLRVDFD